MLDGVGNVVVGDDSVLEVEFVPPPADHVTGSSLAVLLKAQMTELPFELHQNSP